MRFIALACFSFLILTHPIFANGTGGNANPMTSIKALGQGTAFVAQADDPSANYINPAGLVWLDGTLLSLAIGGSLETSVHQGLTVAGNDQTQPSDNAQAFTPGLFASHSMLIGNKKTALGVGISSPFIFDSKWGEGTHARHFTIDYKLNSLLINPNIAVQINRKLSVAAGADFLLVNEEDHHGIFEYFFNNNTGDINQDITYNRDSQGQAYGWNTGVLWKPTEHHSLAMAYRSQLRVDLSGDLKLSNISDATKSNYNFPQSDYSTPVKSENTFPQIMTLGYCWFPNKKSTILIDYEWTGWDSFKRNDLSIDDKDPGRRSLLDPSATPSVRWHNTHSLSIGSEYLYWNNVRVRFGYSRVTSAIPMDRWEPSIPDAGRNLFSIGTGIEWRKITLDFAGAILVFDKRKINNDLGAGFNQSVDGSYTTKIMMLGASLTYRFLH